MWTPRAAITKLLVTNHFYWVPNWPSEMYNKLCELIRVEERSFFLLPCRYSSGAVCGTSANPVTPLLANLDLQTFSISLAEVKLSVTYLIPSLSIAM